jgi:hypothetical protein
MDKGIKCYCIHKMYNFNFKLSDCSSFEEPSKLYCEFLQDSPVVYLILYLISFLFLLLFHNCKILIFTMYLSVIILLQTGEMQLSLD